MVTRGDSVVVARTAGAGYHYPGAVIVLLKLHVMFDNLAEWFGPPIESYPCQKIYRLCGESFEKALDLNSPQNMLICLSSASLYTHFLPTPPPRPRTPLDSPVTAEFLNSYQWGVGDKPFQAHTQGAAEMENASRWWHRHAFIQQILHTYDTK